MILAADVNGGIGKEANLPWRLPNDLAHFRRLTTGNKKNAVFMGRTTWESIPVKFRPLRNRVNFVLSTTMDDKSDTCKVVRSMDQLVAEVGENEFDSVWCIGGATLYSSLLKSGQIDEVYLTRVFGDFDCDVKLDGLYETLKRDFTLKSGAENKENMFGQVQRQNGVDFVFEHYA